MPMNRNKALGTVLLIFAVFFLILSVKEGEGKGGVVVIFPFFYGTGIFALFGVLCLMFGIVLFTISFFESSLKIEESDLKNEEYPFERITKTDKKIKGGGLILIGPIPIIFGSDTKTTVIVVIVALIITVLGFLMWKF